MVNKMAREPSKLNRDKESTMLRSAFFDTVKKNIEKPANQKKLFKYIADYRDRYIQILSSPLITTFMPFNHDGADGNIVFECCGVDRAEVEAKIKETMKTLYLDQVGKNITAFNVIMIMAISVFYDNAAKRQMLYMYYAYSFYFSVFTRQFRNFKPDPATMQYTIDNMNNKYTLKKEGSLDAALNASMLVAINCYADKFARLSDMDIINIINAFKTRVGRLMKNIFVEYDKNYRKGNRVFTTIEKNEEGEIIVDRESNLGAVANLASQYTTKFFANGVNTSITQLVARMCQISETEIRTAITLIQREQDVERVKRYYECLFTLFFENYKNATDADVKTKKFLAAADAIYKKGNSNDKNIETIKKISHEWLATGSSTYRNSKRIPTINNFRKAIYMYFVFMVVNNPM